MTEKVLTHEMFMRHDAAKQVFEFRLRETDPPVEIHETAVPKMIGTADPKQRELLSFLVEEAKKAKGKWVSASDAPIKQGQAVIGNGRN